jgi:hypothetical protein
MFLDRVTVIALALLAAPTTIVLLLVGALVVFRWASWVVSLVVEVDTSNVHEEGDRECIVRARLRAFPDRTYAIGRAWNTQAPFSWFPARFEIRHAPRPYWKIRASTVRGLSWAGFVISRRSYDDPAADAEAEAKEVLRLDAIRARREALLHPVVPASTRPVPAEIGVSCRGCSGVHAAPACTQPNPCCWRCSPRYSRMMLCSACGNKRCPHANDHDNACTGSNEPGQPGSRYTCGTCEKDPCRCRHGDCY